MAIYKDVLDDPKNIENFLKEVDSKWNILLGRTQLKDQIDKEMEKVKKTNDYCCPRTLH